MKRVMIDLQNMGRTTEKSIKFQWVIWIDKAYQNVNGVIIMKEIRLRSDIFKDGNMISQEETLIDKVLFT